MCSKFIGVDIRKCLNVVWQQQNTKNYGGVLEFFMNTRFQKRVLLWNIFGVEMRKQFLEESSFIVRNLSSPAIPFGPPFHLLLRLRLQIPPESVIAFGGIR